MKTVIAEVTVVPLGTGSASLSSYVAEVVAVLKKYKCIQSQLTPMSTILEGDFNEVMSAIREMHEVPFSMGADRVSTHISIDDRRDKAISLKSKVDSIQKKLHSKS